MAGGRVIGTAPLGGNGGQMATNNGLISRVISKRIPTAIQTASSNSGLIITRELTPAIGCIGQAELRFGTAFGSAITWVMTRQLVAVQVRETPTHSGTMCILIPL